MWREETHPWGWPEWYPGPVGLGSSGEPSTISPQANAHGSQSPKITTVNKYKQLLQQIKLHVHLATGAATFQYLQQSEKQGHMLSVLDELVCEMGTQVICLLLGVLICKERTKVEIWNFSKQFYIRSHQCSEGTSWFVHSNQPDLQSNNYWTCNFSKLYKIRFAWKCLGIVFCSIMIL